MNKGALGQLMRQAQQVQDNMRRLQEELAKAEVTGEAGAGMVKVTVNGKHQVKRVQIEPSAFNEGKEFVEDLVTAASNDAMQKVEALTREKMSAATGGLNLNLPPGFTLGS